MHNVSYEDKKQNFQVKDKETLFDALDSLGETLPHGCLSGSCGSCRIEVLEGAENLTDPSAVEEDTIKSIKLNLKRIHGKDYDPDKHNIRLSCRAKVKGDLSFKTI